MRNIPYYPAFLLGVLMMFIGGQLSAQNRDSIVEYYLNNIYYSDSSQFYREKLYEYTVSKPEFSETRFIGCAILLDTSPEKFDSPTNKYLVQSIYNIISSNPSLDDNEKMDGFRILGDYYHDLHSIDQAIKFYNQGLEIAATSCTPLNEIYLSALYTNLSILYLDLNELIKARLLIEKTIEIDINDEEPLSEYLAIDYTMLARTYRPVDPEKSLTFFLKAKHLINTIRQEGKEIHQPEEVKDLYVLIADNYLAIGNPEQALLEIDTALYIYNSPKIKSDLIHGKALKTKAVIFQRTGAYGKALQQYRKADIFLEDKITDIAYRPKLWLQIARCHLARNNPTEAQQQLDMIFRLIDQSGPPHQSRYDKVIFPMDLFQLYYEQAKVFAAKYQKTKKIDFLYEAQKTYQKALNIFETAKHGVSSSESRQVFMKNNAAFFESAIDLNFQLWHEHADSTALEKILLLSEKSKNNFLYEILNKTNASLTEVLPDSILTQIQSLDLKISQTEKKLFQAQSNNKKDKVSTVRDELILHRRDQKIQMKKIEKEYPHFYQLKYQVSVPNIEDIQTKLLPEQGVISYYVGVHHIYVLIIDQWDFSVERIPLDFSLLEKTNTFNNSIIASIKKGAASKKALENYHQTGFFLYQKLIAPFVRKLPSQLIILPDNLLENLSFEALLTALPKNKTAYQDYPYLLKKYNISYQYAADAITRTTSSSKQTDHHFIGFAPTFSDEKPFSIAQLRDFGQLTHNQMEIDNIKKIVGSGLVLKNKKATEENFMKLAPAYQIIHLATHGKVNIQHSDYSYLAFQEVEDSLENELLYIKDIYGLQLKADLVVLSACETANGSLTQGEGIINLARGFTYAGAASVVPTLWKISDIASAKLMENFYVELKAGQPKHIAMANAKHQFLETVSPEFAHPFYWAAFVLIGNPSPIQLPQTSESFLNASLLQWGFGASFFLFLFGFGRYAWKRWR